VAANGEPIRWADYARENRLPSYENKKPKPHTEDDIKGQFRWASGFTLVGLAAAIYTLLNRKKSISADSEAYYDEKKRAVRYDRVFEVDKRKWDNKGLAYLKYKDETDKTVKTRIDDLKFGGAEEILERVISNFKGDLIETVQEEEVENSENEEITAEKINS